MIIYCAGLGAVNQQGDVTNPVSVTFGGQPAQVAYAGVAHSNSYPSGGPPGILGLASASLGGLYQLTATVPSGVPDGQSTVNVSSAGQSSQTGVTLSVGGRSGGPGPIREHPHPRLVRQLH